jgi:flagellar FliJ protein
MSDFKFRLQKVLDLRVWKEQEKALRLHEARERADEAERALEALRAVQTATRHQISVAHGTGGAVGHLQNLSYVLGQLEVRIEEADTVRQGAEAAVQESLSDFTAAFRDRRVLEELRERQAEANRIALGQAERKTMDELAVTRHGRGGDAGTQSEGVR